MIGGFGLKSKDGAIKIVEKVIAGNDGNPTIIKDRVSMVPSKMSLKFDSSTHTETFVRRHTAKLFVFPHKHDGFWCNVSQSLKEREDFKPNLASLFKVK